MSENDAKSLNENQIKRAFYHGIISTDNSK
jgi:hypothetical protein